MKTNALVAAALSGSQPPTTALSARGGAHIVAPDDSQYAHDAAGRLVTASGTRGACVRLCDPDLDIVVHPSTTKRLMPSASLIDRIAERFVVDRASGHLLSAQVVCKRDAVGREARTAPSAKPQQRRSPAVAAAKAKAKRGDGKVEKTTRAPRIHFRRRSWLARTLLYAWAVGEVEYYETAGAVRLVRTCAEPQCLAPGHMETTIARDARELARGET